MVNRSIPSYTRQLNDPAVVIAFQGWNDAADSASGVIEHLTSTYLTTDWIEIDNEKFYDYQLTRPQIRQESEGSILEWPSVKLRIVHLPTRDLIVVSGPEPNLNWKTFSDLLLKAIADVEPEMIVLLGALLSDAPHSRPLPVEGVCNNRALSMSLGFERSTYEGPAGIISVLADSFSLTEIPTVSLWVSVPHYVSNPPNPKATLALIDKLNCLLDIQIAVKELPQQTIEWEQGVSDAADADPDVTDYIRELEERSDRTDLPETIGDDIANELERFLRKRNQD